LHDAVKASVWFPGQLMLGAVWSAGITWKVQEVLLPASSVAVSVIVVAPVITVPAAGDWVMLNDASQLSAAAANPE
jgi:hypothetical protein